MSDKEDDRDELDQDYMSVDEDAPDPMVFKIRRSLGQPIAQSFTTEELHMRIHNGEVDLCPPYQRDVVWPTSKQMEIVDSIYHNFYVPPVIFAVVEDEDGEETRICVDGKQRLTSIQKFFDGQIGYRDPDMRKIWYYTVSETTRATRNEIPEAGKRLFAEKQITCIEYRGLTAAAERDVFQRVQLGMSLTSAEKLQAIASPRADWINQLEAKFITSDDGLHNKFEFDDKRGRTFQNLAFIAYCCAGLPEQQAPTVQKLDRWLCSDERPTAELQSRIELVLQTMWHLADDKKLNTAFREVKAKVAPVEFLYIGVILYVMRSKSHSDEDRADMIHALRRAIREIFHDIRLNSNVCRVCWEIVGLIEEGASVEDILTVAAKQAAAPVKGKRKKHTDDDAMPSSPKKAGPGRRKRTKTAAD
ncbi:hypothetical protein EWM64_g7312 [Hericium alpestre]|uniref:GmrSD restriction endonucleases N-terminal domain-containing protein n=1 Tax=Hericium alpestre TaxID=135208 RepID=A0A4Y9ZR39_9AGAM|nr:hypothetical protein EWM64_g7312 [Hericium alpestre]